jgi:mono/diheme cytochrome c family protein
LAAALLKATSSKAFEQERGMKRLILLSGILLTGAAARAEDVAAGKLLYGQQCVVCHGIKGKGNGPSGKALNPKPTDFTTVTNVDDSEWFKATKLGSKAVGKSNGMEGFAAKLSDEQIRDVLAYVKTMKQ